MTWYLVIYIGFTCPGGWLGGLLIPKGIGLLACQKTPTHTILTDKKEVMRLVREQGPGIRVFWCKNLKCSEKKVEWSQVVEVR